MQIARCYELNASNASIQTCQVLCLPALDLPKTPSISNSKHLHADHSTPTDTSINSLEATIFFLESIQTRQVLCLPALDSPKPPSISNSKHLHANHSTPTTNTSINSSHIISRMSPDNIFSSSAVEGDKAEAIRFLGGRYAGKTGWLRHSRRKRGQLYYYVFVDLGDSTVLKTYVQIDNCESAEMPMPTSYAEALLQQHVDIEVAMNKLANQLATCSIQEGTTQVQLCKIFAEKLYTAMIKQEKKGSKGRYRCVEFETEQG
jgi:hypothetical protein